MNPQCAYMLMLIQYLTVECPSKQAATDACYLQLTDANAWWQANCEGTAITEEAEAHFEAMLLKAKEYIRIELAKARELVGKLELLDQLAGKCVDCGKK